MPRGKGYPGKRGRVGKKKSKKIFRAKSGSHKKNAPRTLMRGGIRL